MSTINFTVKTNTFEGPLDLLLDLIERRKLHVSDVSLATVADDYMHHMQELDSFPTAEGAHFVLIAATLLLIKSKALLPILELSSEEEADISELERRLMMYKHFRKLAGTVRTRFDATPLFASSGNITSEPLFTPHKEITLPHIYKTMQQLIAAFPKEHTLPEAVVDKVMSLEEMIVQMRTRFQKAVRLRFRESVEHGATEREQKLNIVMSFLAMLELVKQGLILVQQDNVFGDIEMQSQSIDTPHYA